MGAETLRARIFAQSRQVLEAHARERKGRSVERPTDILEDIADEYQYEPWDVALIGALTTLLHPRSRVPQVLRAETARITAERRRLLQALRTLRMKFMTGDRPAVSCIQVVLAPRPGVGQIYLTGRPSEWVLDEFAGCILVTLGRARLPDARGPSLKSLGLAFSYAQELLEVVGIHTSRRSLEERAAALPDLPPEPNDEDPLGWADAIGRRLARLPEGDALLRKLLVPESLPLETFRYRLAASSPDIAVRRFTRKALPKKP